MRKACIDLVSGTKIACLLAGAKGTGRCLYMVVVSEDMTKEPTEEQWLKALKLCENKALELKYEIEYIWGKHWLVSPVKSLSTWRHHHYRRHMHLSGCSDIIQLPNLNFITESNPFTLRRI